MFAKAKKFIGHVVPGVIRPIHILWNQVIGFFFIVLALLPVHPHHSRLGKRRHAARAWRWTSLSSCSWPGSEFLLSAARKISKS